MVKKRFEPRTICSHCDKPIRDNAQLDDWVSANPVEDTLEPMHRACRRELDQAKDLYGPGEDE